MVKENRLLLVGWDAADWKVIRPLMEAGGMPNLRRLIEAGTSGNLTTLSPVLSPMLWTSIATGKRPYKHGIYGFIEPTPQRDGIQPITNLSRKTKALWNVLSQNDLTSNVVGWWPSHPAEPIRGVMVSNQYQRAPKSGPADWPMRPETVHPAELAEELAELRFHPAELEPAEILDFVPEAARIDQSKDHRLDTLARIIADATSIQSAATHLIESRDWDFTAVYFDAIDHFCHAFMRFHPPRMEHVSEEDFELYRHVVSAGYIYHDMMLGRLIELAGDDATVMVISDHGFHPGELRRTDMPVEPAGPAVEHRDLGIFVMRGPGIKSGHVIGGASLLDVTPTILTYFGLPVSEDMDGRPLVDAFTSVPDLQTVPSWDDIPGQDGRHPPERAVAKATSREALKQLADLGYIEEPGDDIEKTVLNAERELKYNLALSYMDAGIHPKAVQLLVDLYRQYPLEFRFGLRLALCYQATEQVEQMAQVVKHLDTTWKVAAGAAREKIKGFRARLAERAAERKAALAEVDPDADDADFNPRQLITEAERGVLRQLQGIARGNPRTIDYLMASIAAAREEHDAALEHLERARATERGSPGFHLQVGNAYLGLGRLPEAAECFQRVVELESENPLAQLGLARVALRSKDGAAAVAHARAAVELKYHNPAAHYFLGEALLLEGEMLEAVAAMETAIALNPNFAEAHRRLAKVHKAKLRDTVRAVQHEVAARQLADIARDRKKTSAVDFEDQREVDIEAELPDFPEDPGRHMSRPLGAARVDSQALPSTPPAIIVSGLPRSGTSMAMQMLAAGGMPVLSDGERTADENNPLGYLEYNPAKALMTRNDWLSEARGKVLKVVAPLVPFLPQDEDYRVILMERPATEIAASQRRMLERLGHAGADLDEDQMRRVMEEQVRLARAVLEAHGVPTLVLQHKEVIDDPVAAAESIADFLSAEHYLDRAAMAAAVDPSLWRERVS